MSVLGDKRNQLNRGGATNPQLVIPKIPFHPIPKRVADAFPELVLWNDEQHKKLEKWRVETNVAVFGAIPETT